MSTTRVTVNAYTEAAARLAVTAELSKQKIDARVVGVEVAAVQRPDHRVAINVTLRPTGPEPKLTYEVIVKRTSLAVRDQKADFEAAHAEGLHDDLAREGCPLCDDKRNRTA